MVAIPHFRSQNSLEKLRPKNVRKKTGYLTVTLVFCKNKLMAKIWIVISIIIVVIAAGAYYMFMGNKPEAPGTEKTATTNTSTVQTTYKDVTERTVSLKEQNGSGESGSAVLTEKDGKVTVVLDMTGFAADVPQPAHIHSGSCPDVGAVAYPLTNVVNGKSATVLDTTFAKLDAKEPLAINVHKSVPETKVYVSCGNLGTTAPVASVSPSSSPAGSATPAPSAAPSASPVSSPAASPTTSPSPAASAN